MRKPKSLQDLAVAQVIKNGLFSITVPRDTTPEYQERVAHTIEPLVLEEQRKLLQAVVDGDQLGVKKILDQNPELLELAAPDDLVIESQLTWQRFKAEHPLVMALKRDQVKMVEVMTPYFEKLDGGDKEALRQWRIADQQKQAAKTRSENFDFESLIDVITKETFLNGKDISTKNAYGTTTITTFSQETEDALEAFRKAVLPDEAVLCDYYDINELLKAALKAYATHFDKFKSNNAREQRTIFCVKVIGFIQSLFSREDAEVWCEGLCNVVEENKKIRERAKKLKQPGGDSFYRSSRSSHGGLGFEYFIGRSGMPIVRWTPWLWQGRLGVTDRWFVRPVEELCKAKAAELGQLKKQLCQPSGPVSALMNCLIV